MAYKLPTSREIQDAYSCGCDAFLNGTPLQENPYPIPLHHAFLSHNWENGWVDTAKEHRHTWNQRTDNLEIREGFGNE